MAEHGNETVAEHGIKSVADIDVHSNAKSPEEPPTMSAKKAAPATTPKSLSKPSPSSGRKSPANGKATSSAATVPLSKPAAQKPAAERTLTTVHIGEVAGEVWRLLFERDAQTLAAIKKSIDAPADVVVAAVGWLAREGKLEFVVSGRAAKVSLKP